MRARRLPKWSELEPLLRVRPVEWNRTKRRLDRALTIAHIEQEELGRGVCREVRQREHPIAHPASPKRASRSATNTRWRTPPEAVGSGGRCPDLLDGSPCRVSAHRQERPLGERFRLRSVPRTPGPGRCISPGKGSARVTDGRGAAGRPGGSRRDLRHPGGRRRRIHPDADAPAPLPQRQPRDDHRHQAWWRLVELRERDHHRPGRIRA
jgi:hypothetical protein